MFITKSIFTPDRSCAGVRRHARAAVARRDGSGADAAREDGRRAAAALRVRLRPHGVDHGGMDARPSGHGFEFSPILKPLERFRNQLNVFTRPDQRRRERPLPSTAMWLERHVPVPRAASIHLGTTIDQIIAQKIGQDTTFPSMEFATEDHSSHLGSCAGDFLLLVHEHHRLADADAAAADGDQPARRLRADVRRRRRHARRAAGAPGAEHQHPRRGERERCRSAARPRGQGSRQARRVPRRTSAKSSGASSRPRRQRTDHLLDTPPAPIGVPENWEEHVKLMFELMALAYQGDMTRVTTFMMARELSTLTYPQIGVADGASPGVTQQRRRRAGGQEG